MEYTSWNTSWNSQNFEDEKLMFNKRSVNWAKLWFSNINLTIRQDGIITVISNMKTRIFYEFENIHHIIITVGSRLFAVFWEEKFWC